MKNWIACANRYLAARDWKMMAGVKLCMGAIGVLLGLSLPGKHKKTGLWVALAVFAVTYVPLMTDFLWFAGKSSKRLGEKSNCDG